MPPPCSTDTVVTLLPSVVQQGAGPLCLRTVGWQTPARATRFRGFAISCRDARFKSVIRILKKLYLELDRLLEARGRGAVQRVQADAGLGETYIRDLRDRLADGVDRRYDLSALLRMLEALGVPPGAFFGKVFGALEPIALTQLETRRLGEPPELVARVKERLLLEQWQPLVELPEHLRRLDAHRYENAVEAARFARADLEEVAAGLRPLAQGVPLLAVYGSALRMTDRFNESQQAVVAAIEAAESTGDEAILGDLVQRLAYVVADRSGDYGRALQLAEKAMVHHVAAGDMNAAGTAFVDRGLWQYKLGRYEEAIRSQRRALELLDDSEHRNRFSALQVQGLCWCELGELEQAHKNASQASELAPWVGALMRVKLLRLQARIAVDRRRYGAAEEHLREAIEAFGPTSVDEAAVATVELVRVLQIQNRTDNARETAKSMTQFVIPLQDRSVAAAAAAHELLKRAQAGCDIPLELLHRVIEVLEDERARPRERARSKR